ncbi:MAG: hypothetical protein DRN00_05310 [Thermoplasmata archaeon]|nr:MAG: hypothetical protein DRN00_05310 [Thermoplasmata archaeon]
MVKFEEFELGKTPREAEMKVIDGEIVEGRGGRKQLHLIMKPLDKEWKNQHEWYGFSTNKSSAFFEFTNRLIGLGVLKEKEVENAETLDDLAKLIIQKLTGKTFYWKEEKIGRKAGFAWVPVELKK